MKKFAKLVIALLLSFALLPGLGQTVEAASGGEKLSIVCTIFPQYDWVRQILGERAKDVELTLLLNSGIDIHSYQPSVADIVKVSSCDMFIYVGGESDAWVPDALKEAVNPDMVVINLVEALGEGIKIEEIIEGMEDDHEHGHEEEAEHEDELSHEEEAGHEDELSHEEEAEHEDEHGHEEEAEHEGEHDHEEEVPDEHVWLSLKCAETLCAVITDALASLDAANADLYTENLKDYLAALSALDAKYQQAVDAAPVKTLLFGDRFPFRYLVDDYGIAYHAAFPGCTAETEASFETIIFLANKTDELALNTVMVTESADQSIARTIIESTRSKNQNIRVLDAMQSITRDTVEDGLTYISVMESNLNVLTDSLK